MLAPQNTVKHHYERAIASDPEFVMARYSYARFLIEVLDAPEEARPHPETALRLWHNAGDIGTPLTALYWLVRICREMDDEDAAIEYCERAIDIYDDSLWFKSVHAILTETNIRTQYTYGLTNILEDDTDFATELFELVWEKRDEYTPDSDTHRITLSAGIALAASIQLYDDLDALIRAMRS